MQEKEETTAKSVRSPLGRNRASIDDRGVGRVQYFFLSAQEYHFLAIAGIPISTSSNLTVASLFSKKMKTSLNLEADKFRQSRNKVRFHAHNGDWEIHLVPGRLPDNM